MKMIPYDREAYDLLHQGTIALADVECQGIPIDLKYIDDAIKKTKRRAERKEDEIRETAEGKMWLKTYGRQTNFDSPTQLSKVLFEKMGYKPIGETKKGYRTDKNALKELQESWDVPFVDMYVKWKELGKASGTYFNSILREAVNGKVHCFYNLNRAISYRSSCDNINFQNIPIRDPFMMGLIRRAFVASEGRQLVEMDFKGAEVITSACYHQDPNMIKYLLDPKKDMHRDAAMDLFMLEKKDVSDAIRHIAKNSFVFAEFYGDWYISITKGLWKRSGEDVATTNGGIQLREHLRAHGITSMGALDPDEDPDEGSLEGHVRGVERKFWKQRFPVYAQWKKDFYEQYQRRGWFKTHTGFICQGHMKRNEAVNYPIQGSSFHALLKTLIMLVNTELRRRKMKTKVIGQIHDSIVADVVPSELDEYLALCHEIVVVRLKRMWPWLVIPMGFDVGVCPVGGSWADKVKHKVKT